MDDEPTTLGKLRTNIAGRAGAALGVLNDFKTRVAEFTTTAEGASGDAQAHAKAAKEQLEAAQNSNNAIEKIKTEANTTYSNFTEIMDEALAEETGAKAKLVDIEDAHTKSGKLKDEISGYRDESMSMKKDVSDSKEASGKMQGELKTLLSESNDIRGKIEKTYKLATDAGLAGALAKRKTELNTQVYVWLAISVAAMAVTVIIILSLFKEIAKTDQEATIILSKLFFVSPTAVFTLFAISQYRNERRLLEEYAFKAAMANSLESYTELLGREFAGTDYKQQILDFVLPVMGNIYDRSALIAPKLTFNWSIGSKIAKLEATVKEEAHNIVEKTAVAKNELSTQLKGVVNEVKEVTDPVEPSEAKADETGA